MKDIRVFSGGADYDSDPRNVDQSDYLDSVGVTTGTSAKGSLVNMFGNTLINYDLPSGDNTCIGTLRNIRENSIIYFVYNSLGNHSILEYYCETKTIEPILIPFTSGSLTFTTEFLGFTLENKIHSSNIVDDILTWVDNNVSPRKINKKSARAFLNQTPPSATVFPYDNLIATGPLSQRLQFIETIQYKPSQEPDIELMFDPNRKTNYIKEKMIQVKYRYIYLDNERSRWSDGSYVSLPTDQENINGIYSNTIANNFLRVSYNTGHPNVKAIDIAFRFGNTEPWSRIDSSILKYDNDNQRISGMTDFTIKTYDFYNDGVLVVEADDYNNYDAVPLVSKTQEIIDNNRLVYANNLEGYENPELQASVSYENVDVDAGDSIYVLTSSVTPSDMAYENAGGPSNEQFYLYVPPNKPSYIEVGSVFSAKINRRDASSYNIDYDFTYIVTANDLINWPINFIYYGLVPAMQETVQFVDPLRVDSALYSGYSIYPQGGFYNNGEYTRMDDAVVVPPSQKIMSWKKGAWHPFGIVYKDAQGRDGGVLAGQSLTLYNPYLPEIYALQPLNNQIIPKTKAKFTISHRPPTWATKYEIVYALNDLIKYTQFVIKGNPIKDSEGNYSIDCSYIIDYITKRTVVASVDFQFETGDKLRFISNADNYVQTYIEAKCLAFNPSTNILTVSPYSSSQVTAGMATATQEGTLVEFYSNKKSVSAENRFYYSIGETYDVINPGTSQRAHAGNVANQNPATGTPATVSLNRGDCYIYRRYFDNNTIETVIESESFSDFYASKNIDISAIYAVIPNGKSRRYEQGIRYGGRYFPNTNTNNLCQFNGSDYDTLNTRYGPINKLATVGYTLKVLQTKKNTSIYVDRNMIFSATGEAQLTLTDKVLGNKNPSELDYGCEHPESVCVDDRQLYFFDVNTGTFIQDSANGMYPVSEYKAKTYFRNISEKIKNANNVYVYAGVDNFNNYITVTFVDKNTERIIPDQTICYHPIDNRWKGKQHYTPEYYGSNAMVLTSFKDGQLWIHNDPAAPRNNFYGEQYDMSVSFVANMDYPKVKVFSAIAINASHTFSSPNSDPVTGEYDIEVPSTPTYPQGMKSRLLPSRFRWKEGVQYADYLRDALTPNIPTVERALLEGRKLRGAILLQTIRNTSTDEATLYSVIVHSTPSELSK